MKRLVALMLTASMAFSMTACGNSKTKDEVLDVAEDYMDELVSRELSSGDNVALIQAALLEQVEYEIDEDSFEYNSKKGKASVDVIITYVDGEDICEDGDFNVDLETLIDAIEDADTEDTTWTLELKLDKHDKWVVDNDSDIEDLLDEILTIGRFDPDEAWRESFSIEELYEGHTWYNTDPGTENIYTNATYINFWGIISDTDELVWGDYGFYVEVEYNGELVYEGETDWVDYYFYPENIDGYTGEYLPEGTYTISLYTTDGVLLDTDSCNVYVYELTDIDLTRDYATPMWSPSVDRDIYESANWVDPETGDYSNGIFNRGDSMQLDLLVTEDNPDDLYYALYHFNNLDEIIAMATSDSPPTPYEEGYISYTEHDDINAYHLITEDALPGYYIFMYSYDEVAFDGGNGDYICFGVAGVQ
ncbi:MAG: hypothetical protein MJ094_04210 [Saccharofermentans sp.]|nr:hypothetical protein [Saccharofermentans sp.]